MLIEAVIEKGQVRFLQPVKFTHDYFSLKIEIPDQELVEQLPNNGGSVETATLPAEYLAFQALQAAAFGVGYQYKAEQTDREIMQAHWVGKYA
ncbi:MAG: hypothetical protein ACXWTX_01295 [Gallionella sp.]